MALRGSVDRPRSPLEEKRRKRERKRRIRRGNKPHCRLRPIGDGSETRGAEDEEEVGGGVTVRGAATGARCGGSRLAASRSAAAAAAARGGEIGWATYREKWGKE